jgi:hypothetical protein
VFASRENTDDVKQKNQVIREAFFGGTIGDITKQENHKIMELIFDKNIKDKDVIERIIEQDRQVERRRV